MGLSKSYLKSKLPEIQLHWTLVADFVQLLIR